MRMVKYMYYGTKYCFWKTVEGMFNDMFLTTVFSIAIIAGVIKYCN